MFGLFLAFVITPVVLAYYLGMAVDRLLAGRRKPPARRCLTCNRPAPNHLAEFLHDLPALPQRVPGERL